MEYLRKALRYRNQKSAYYQWGKAIIAALLFCLLLYFKDLIVVTSVFLPSLLVITVMPLLSIKTINRSLIAGVFIAVTALFYLANQISNTPGAINLKFIMDIMFSGKSFSVSVLYQVWPAILWWLFGLFKKMRLELYVLGLVSTQLINWIASVDLMASDPRDGLAWFVIIFVQPYMFVTSMIIFYVRDVVEKRINAKYQADAPL